MAPKQFFADGGGFFGPNSTHPVSRIQTVGSTSWKALGIIMVPFAVVVMFGRCCSNMSHATVIYGVMMAMLVPLIWLCVSHRLGHRRTLP